MDVKTPIRQSLNLSSHILQSYIEDLSDADLFVRPVPGMNTIAWQLGHLLVTEHAMVEAIHPGISPALPDGYADAYTKETTTLDDPSKFDTKEAYLTMMQAQRKATLAALEAMSQEDLEKPGPERMARMAATAGEVLNMMGLHWLMHVGQFVPVRRMAHKPIAI